MEGDMNQASTLCRGGCGFFGSPAAEGFCSKCFKDSVKRKQDTTARLSPTSLTPISSNPTESPATVPSTSTVVAAAAVVADKLREVVSCAQAAKSSEEVTAVMESAEAVAAAAVESLASSGGTIGGCSSGTSSAGISASSSAVSLDTMDSSGDVSGSPGAIAAAPAKKPNRCQMCKKRVGLTGFACRCGGLFCGEHRYSTVHSCTFDYKSMEREELRKNNPVIVSEKIQRI
jgi:hypothetical protein